MTTHVTALPVDQPAPTPRTHPVAAPARATEPRAARLPAAAGVLEGLRRPGIGALLSVATLVLAVGWALLPDLFATHDPLAGDAAAALNAPSTAHWFGTDPTGRDLYSRVVHGAVHSLTGALVAVGVGLGLGTLIGVVAGSAGGPVEDVLMRVVDVLLAIPGLLLAVSIIILLGFGTTNAAIAVGVTNVATFARLSRSEVVRVRRSDYVEAAFGSGGRFGSVLWRHVLPNSLNAVLALAALQFGTAILAISTISFLGYGAPPPTPEWGLMIAEGRNYVATAWWLTTLPGLALVLVVLAAHRISTAIAEREGTR